jgi:hypothetical protein
MYSYYYAYTDGVPAGYIKLLASHDKTDSSFWFKPYLDEIWNASQFQMDPGHGLSPLEEYEATLAELDPAHIHKLSMNYAAMNALGIAPMAPDPKLPPEGGVDWAPHESPYEIKNELLPNFEAAASSFGNVVRAVRDLRPQDPIGRFADVLTAMQTDLDQGMYLTADIVRQPASGYESDLLALVEAGLTPVIPPHDDWPDDLPPFSDDRQGWRFKLLFILIYVYHNPFA